MSEKQEYLKIQNLLDIGNINASLGACISEFIDNSISSIEINDLNLTRFDKYFIEIVYNDYCEEYEIYDNAYGIDKNIFNQALEQYHNINTDSKNQYGVGLKYAIFNISKSKNLKHRIYSKTENENEYCGYWIVSDADIISTNVEISNQDKISNKGQNRGTCIKICEVQNSMKLNTDKRIAQLKDFIGIRYSKYIEKGLNIKLTVTSSNADIQIYQENIHPTNYLSKDKTFKWNKIDCTNIDKIIEDHYNSWKQNPKNNNLSIESIEKFWDLIKNKQDLIITLPFVYNNIEGQISFSILEKANDKICGVSILHLNRYIKHPLTKYEDAIIKPYSWSGGGRENTNKWLYAEIDLKNIPFNENYDYIIPEKNKKDLINNDIYNHNNPIITIDNLKEIIKNIGKSLEPITELIKTLSLKDNKKNSQNEQYQKAYDNNQISKSIKPIDCNDINSSLYEITEDNELGKKIINLTKAKYYKLNKWEIEKIYAKISNNPEDSAIIMPDYKSDEKSLTLTIPLTANIFGLDEKVIEIIMGNNNLTSIFIWFWISDYNDK